MKDYGRAIAPDTFQIQRLLPGPVDRVWSYLVESEKRKPWFAGGEIDPHAGGKLQFWFQHSNLAPPGEPVPEKFAQPNKGMASEATVMRFEPPRVLALEWGEGEVTFELESNGEQTLMTITHRKLPNREEVVDVAGGWHVHLDVLGDVLRGERERRPFWAKVTELHATYEQRIPPTPAADRSAAGG